MDNRIKKFNITPYGEDCIIVDETIREIILSQAKGNYQINVAKNLCDNGYIIGYIADGGTLKGKAGKYQSKYARSMNNLMDRIGENLPNNIVLIDGKVGIKGAFGYYLTNLL